MGFYSDYNLVKLVKSLYYDQGWGIVDIAAMSDLGFDTIHEMLGLNTPDGKVLSED